MTTTIKGKNLVLIISVIAWDLALFFTAKLASAETKLANQEEDFAGWYKAEDALPVMHHHNNAEKMMKRSETASVTTGSNLISSGYESEDFAGWYEAEDALPYVGMQKSKAMAQKAPADRQANTVEDRDKYSWIDTEDALPK